jgi:hypothetical protein
MMNAATARIVSGNGKLGVTIIGNGIQVSYIVALTNVILQLIVSFGVTITATQEALITTTVNLLMLIGARAVFLAHKSRTTGGDNT